MINNKIVTIKKQTKFDKGWSLVMPYCQQDFVNKNYNPLSINDIVGKISYANTIYLILSEICLSSLIVEELKWISKYRTIKIIAKNQNVLDKYKQINFNEVIIDKNISFNFVSIIGKDECSFFVNDGYVSCNNKELVDIYFSKLQFDKYQFLKTADFLLVVDYDTKIYQELMEKALENNCSTFYLVNSKKFDKKLVYSYVETIIELLVSNFVHSGVFFSKNNKLYQAKYIENIDYYVTEEVGSLKKYFGEVFVSLKQNDMVDFNQINSSTKSKVNYFICEKGQIVELSIEKCLTINKLVECGAMKDFIEENFDKSETDNFNQYCDKATTVCYNFTLVPPVLTSNKISKMYDTVKTLIKKIDGTQIEFFDTFMEEMQKIDLTESDIFAKCFKLIECLARLNKCISKHEYSTFYSVANIFKSLTIDLSENIIPLCVNAYSMISDTKNENNFSKLDEEIDRYFDIIRDKQAEIDNGKNVLQNKNRIKQLEKQIEEKRILKDKFVNSKSNRKNVAQSKFTELCEILLERKTISHNLDSIGRIINTKDTPKITQIENFVEHYLYEFVEIMKNFNDIADKLCECKIVTDYLVYEQDGKNVIGIDNVEEYHSTNKIREEFNLYCYARR